MREYPSVKRYVLLATAVTASTAAKKQIEQKNIATIASLLVVATVTASAVVATTATAKKQDYPNDIVTAVSASAVSVIKHNFPSFMVINFINRAAALFFRTSKSFVKALIRYIYFIILRKSDKCAKDYLYFKRLQNMFHLTNSQKNSII